MGCEGQGYLAHGVPGFWLEDGHGFLRAQRRVSALTAGGVRPCREEAGHRAAPEQGFALWALLGSTAQCRPLSVLTYHVTCTPEGGTGFGMAGGGPTVGLNEDLW
jgi:hypothetical protein